MASHNRHTVVSVDDFKKSEKIRPATIHTKTAAEIATEIAQSSKDREILMRMRDAYEREIALLAEQVRTLRGQLELRDQAERSRRAAEQEKIRKLSPQEMRQRLDDILGEFNCEPARELVVMAMAKDEAGRFLLSPDSRSKILMFLNKFRMPELKAVETSGTVQHDHRVLIMRFGDKAETARDITPVSGGEQLALRG